MKPTLAFLKQIAYQAGQIVQSFVDEEMDVQHKSLTDLVTKADHASEEYLIDTIRKAFPDHAIIAEESGEWQGTEAHQWYIDPLDGTLNFAHGVPIYCVSVGYAYQGQVVLGVVYDPTREEFFCAERGQGATLNDKQIHVSEFKDLIDCMLVTGFPTDIWGTKNDNTENFFRFSKLTQSVRRLGSAALDVVYVAAGRLDGFWEVEICQWDVAAGGLIVEEAGGLVTDLYGELNYMEKPVSFLCANPTIHQKMLNVLDEVRREQEQE